jgi:four helix bundle protein
MRSYRNLFIWQASVELAARVLQLTETFSYRRLALADQMQRAAISVPSNIAEGHGRLSDRERRRFLGIARGSLHELETQLDIAARAGVIPAALQAELMSVIRQIGAGINTLIRQLSVSVSQSLCHSRKNRHTS